jgi:hypothetical protein
MEMAEVLDGHRTGATFIQDCGDDSSELVPNA